MTVSYIVYNNIANFMTRLPKVIFLLRIDVIIAGTLAPTSYLYNTPAHLRPSK